MSHDRKGLTVLSLLLILIGLGLIGILLFRVLGGGGAIEQSESPSFSLQIVRAPAAQVPPGATDTVAVRAVDPAGAPLAGFSVSFSVSDGGGSVEPASAVTDAEGVAVTAWTLGEDTATNQLTASLDSEGVPPLVIAVEITGAGAP